jgi:Zn-dependent protease with chaperone function
MDFFQSQDDARRRSKLLLFYFALAIVAIIATLYGVSLAIEAAISGNETRPVAPVQLWDPGQLGLVSLVTLAVILCGSGFKTLQLMRGGEAIALDLGGRPIDPSTSDFDERKVLNLVEEMALASGCPVPKVFLLEDESINAFAAGNTPSDAVIGVTRGCVSTLSRDELQGVIAHEFSHILNGDMRLNLRIVGLLFGILLIALLGQILLRASWYTGRGRNGREVGIALAVGGLALYIIGYIGVFFAHLIKSALSRQREFLADASAVQFTRNPEGIGGALKKIGGLSAGSLIASPKAEEASHMFFANGLSAGLSSLFASHPPLHVRIRQIDPQWDGRYPSVTSGTISRKQQRGKTKRPAGQAPLSPGASGFAGSPDAGAMHGGASLLRGFEGPVHQELDAARQLREAIPEAWLEDLRHPAGAQALVLALLLSREADADAVIAEQLHGGAEAALIQQAGELAREFGSLDSTAKLALLDLAIPVLRRLGPGQYDQFRTLTENLIRRDGQIDLFEFTLQKVLTRHLDRAFGRTPPPRTRKHSAGQLSEAASVLLSSMAGLGTADEAGLKVAFARGGDTLEKTTGLITTLMPPGSCGLVEIDAALDCFELVKPAIKRALLEACAQTAFADDHINSNEAELLRAIADTVGVPLPPFVR